jgi:hypothetical protein
MAAAETREVQGVLERLGLSVPAGDLPFLQRTLARQQDLRRALRAAVPPETEPAHVFRPPGSPRGA